MKEKSSQSALLSVQANIEKMAKLMVLLVLLVCVSFSLAKPEDVEHGASAHKSRHYKDRIHNPAFDTEALFGSRLSDELSDLAPEVRIKRLRNLAQSHDTNKDGFIEANELREWVLHSFRLIDNEEAVEKVEEDDENKDGKVTFAEIAKKHYGYTEEDLIKLKEEHGDDLEKSEGDEEEIEILKISEDDRHRFKVADLNNDGALDHKEYVAYLQPYDYPHMYEVEMDRSMSDLDKDKDGYVSKQEFIDDELDEEARKAEETNFKELDKDNDGKLNREELRHWAVPDNSDITDDEVEHLMKECDENNDGKLSVEEIISKEEEFMGSSTTDYGRHLHFVRDEL